MDESRRVDECRRALMVAKVRLAVTLAGHPTSSSRGLPYIWRYLEGQSRDTLVFEGHRVSNQSGRDEDGRDPRHVKSMAEKK